MRTPKHHTCLFCVERLKKDKQFEDWANGATFEITFGYPSPLDGITFTGAICVACANRLAKFGALKMIRNEFGEGKKKYIPLPK